MRTGAAIIVALVIAWILAGVVAVFLILLQFAARPAHAHMTTGRTSTPGLCSSRARATACAAISARPRPSQMSIGRLAIPASASNTTMRTRASIRVRLYDKWWLVPDAAVVEDPNRAGTAIVWPVWYGDAEDPHRRLFVRCFMPRAGTDPATFFLVLTIIMPGERPDIQQKFPYTSIDDCWADARDFVAHGVPKVRQGWHCGDGRLCQAQRAGRGFVMLYLIIAIAMFAAFAVLICDPATFFGISR